ncbi:MAG: 3-dehydroquinate synthase [Planctomycetota bacterium]
MDVELNRDQMAEQISVALGDRSYPIHLANRATGQFAAVLTDALADLTHLVMIVDEAVIGYARQLNEALAASGSFRLDLLEVPSGEPTKSISEFERLLMELLALQADRRSVIVAVGGGVVGDLAGYVAASFARGIRFVQVPTTLLAMVDSSVGGKTGINLPGGKNMVGAFWQPQLVWIDPHAMQTLDDRSYRSGLAEVVKYGVINDEAFFHWLTDRASSLVQRNPDALVYAIRRSCESKARVVGEDERETSGRRAILNYGHTFAHAIEATAGYGKLLHGEAVAIGMQMAASLAIKQGLCSESLLESQTSVLEACGLPVRYPEADADAMLPVMMRDKKVQHGKLRFILPRSIGHVELVDNVPESQVRSAIEDHR